MKKEITIIVEGGLIQDIKGVPKNVKVKVVDFDCDEELGAREEVKKVKGRLAWVTQWVF